MPIKVRVRNFQSLEDVSLTIDGLTVVTGTNNAGKSALFRAIQGVFINRAGNNFVRHGAKNCTVDLTFEDGRTLTWEKGAKGQKINRYVIDGKPYDNVGAGVPPEVEEFGVTSVVLNDEKFWPQIARQVTDVNFLLDRSGSVMAEAVADVERVNQLNRALKFCESDRKKARSALKVRRSDAQDLGVKMTRYQGLDEVVASVDSLSEKRDRLRKMRQVHADVSKLGVHLTSARETLRSLQGVEGISLPDEDRFTKADKTRQALSGALKLKARWDTTKKALDALEGVGSIRVPEEDRFAKANKAQKALGDVRQIAKRLKEAQAELDVAGIPSDALDSVPTWDEARLKGIDKAKQTLVQTRELRSKLQRAKNSLEETVKDLTDVESGYKVAQNAVTEILGDLEECPTCGKAL